MSALIIPIARDKEPAPGPITWRDMLGALERISAAMDWLSAHQVAVLGFGCTRQGPVVTVAASPAVYTLFKARVETVGQHQVGALRHVLWEATAPGNVRVLWEEVAWAA